MMERGQRTMTDVPDYFVEDKDEPFGMRFGASAVIHATRIGQMRLVIRRIEVHTIPVRRGEDLNTKTIWAVAQGETGAGRLIDTKADEAESLLFEAAGAVASTVRIASKLGGCNESFSSFGAIRVSSLPVIVSLLTRSSKR